MNTMSDEIRLKWGTLKGWNVSKDNEAAFSLLEQYHEDGICMSAAMQKDTPKQKQILCDLVSLPNIKIYLDWDGKYVSKEEAISYITNYGKKDD